MSRCICCDTILSSVEMSRKKSDGAYEDLCGDCSNLVEMDVDGIFNFHEYAFGDLTTYPLPVSSNLFRKMNE